jgi:methylphosphotriester-DNA--protein-cysteine methyltransferase
MCCASREPKQVENQSFFFTEEQIEKRTFREKASTAI